MKSSNGKLLVVENDEQRLREMRRVCADQNPPLQFVEMTNAPDAIMWLSKHVNSVGLISLDFDLGTDEELANAEFDVGNGGDVARWLGARAPFCPVILHTDNFFCRPTMQKALAAGGWAHYYVAPGNGTSWIANAWLPLVLRCLNDKV